MEKVEELLDLPPEMLIEIFKLCNRVDIINVACCCRQCHCLVVHLLYEYFEIGWSDITSASKISANLRNISYCTCLVFHDKNNTFHDGSFIPVNTCLWEDVNANYLRILRCCDEDKLRTLYILNSKISDSALELTLNKFKNVQNLRLEECLEVTSSSLVSLGTLCSLTKLHINSCNVTDNDISRLVELTQLEDISILLCRKITNATLYFISQISTLKRVHYCEYGILDPNGWTSLANLTELKVLDIGGCLIDRDDLIYLAEKFINLDVLNVSNIIVTNEEFYHISKMASLTRIGFSGCNILDEELVYLSNLKLLHTLDLSWHNDISDLGILQICRVRTLISLSLRFCNKVTDDGIKLLNILPLLKTLDISDCELLTDTCLLYISVFPSLRVLHIIECTGFTEAGINRLLSLRNIRLEERDFELEDRENLSATY